jgi:PAS domain S-box-containing protein
LEKNYLRYLYALLAVPLAILLRYALMPLIGPGTPYITLFPITVAVALLAGLGPSILTGILGSITIDYLFIEPLYVFEFNTAGFSRMAVVVLTSAFVGYVGDVLRTARTKAEQQALALRESQADLNRAQAVANTGSWRLDVKKNELSWSDEVYRMFGIPKGTPLTYESFISFIHPDDRQFVDTKWEAAMAGGTYDIEHRIIVDGKIKWVRERAELEIKKDGTLLGGFGTVTDITERRQMEDELRKSHDELEKRVVERTAQLTRTVETLEKAEKIIKAERKRFEDVLEMMPAYAVLLTPDYRVAFANRTFRDWFGDDNGKKCYEFLFNRTEPCENCETYNVMKTGKSQFWEWTGPNGHNYDIYDYPFTDIDGSPLIMEIGVDVTAHKQTQNALRSTSLYARSLIEASLDPLVTISPEGKITDVNKGTELVTGLSRESLIGSDFSNYFTEPGKAKEGYQKVLSDGQVKDYPLSIHHKSGHITDVLYNATVYKNEAGEVQGVFAAARDITARKAAEKRQSVTNSLLELFASKTSRKKYLDAVVEVIRDWSVCNCAGIRIKDNEGNIPYESCVGFKQDFLKLENALRLNNDNCICVRAMLQQPQEQDKVLLTAGGSFHWNDADSFVKELPEHNRANYRANCILYGFQSVAVIPIRYHKQIMGVIHLADSQKNMVSLPKIHFIESTIAPLIGEAVQRFNAEAELEKYRLHLEDLVKQQTDELTRSNKDLEQFAYVTSHDLQEPLRMIAGYTQLLQQRYKDKLDEDANQFIFYTVDGVMRMQNLINDLLTYSRLGTSSEALEPVDCNAVLDEVLATLQMTIEENGAVIKYRPLPNIRADRTQLLQLFQNLIGNAIKFRSDKPPIISITAKPQDKQWLFSVSDNGIGIEPQYLERIFVIFQRLHTRDKYPGTGIGLAICKKIVERHGGRIWAESQLGKGSTFHFII